MFFSHGVQFLCLCSLYLVSDIQRNLLNIYIYIYTYWILSDGFAYTTSRESKNHTPILLLLLQKLDSNLPQIQHLLQFIILFFN